MRGALWRHGRVGQVEGLRVPDKLQKGDLSSGSHNEPERTT
jgi:hypothetical protein